MKSKPKLYLETSVVSYLTARPTRDLVMAAHQEITQQWWDTHRTFFSIVISQLVLDEASQGDPLAASRRLAQLKGFPLLSIDEQAVDLATEIITHEAVPKKAWVDALHLAIAAVHQIHFLLTWNCRHLNNPVLLEQVEVICAQGGYKCPVVCTPEQMIENTKL